ncbi:Uncharacterised protein [Bordetella pertussis]|nr:Uncharacterised protein [Bordetella pertussis]
MTRSCASRLAMAWLTADCTRCSRAGAKAAGLRHGGEGAHLVEREVVQHDRNNRSAWTKICNFMEHERLAQ